jgi:hypothetical protein
MRFREKQVQGGTVDYPLNFDYKFRVGAGMKNRLKSLKGEPKGLRSDGSTVSTTASPEVQCRNEKIRRYRNLPVEEVCIKLDAELGRGEGRTAGLPESWHEKHGVTSFLASYKNPDCRSKLQKLISVAKSHYHQNCRS